MTANHKLPIYPHPCAKHRRAFTIIELLVVIAVIAILSMILITGISRARSQSLKAQSISNIRSCYAGISLFLMDNAMQYPGTGSGARDRWSNRVGAYMNIGPVVSRTLGSGSVDIVFDAHRQEVFRSAVTPHSAYKSTPTTNLIGAFGINPLIMRDPAKSDQRVHGISASSIDNPSRTVLLAERYAGADGTSSIEFSVNAPYGKSSNNDSICSNYPTPAKNQPSKGPALICFADGHTAMIVLDEVNPWPGSTLKDGVFRFAPN